MEKIIKNLNSVKAWLSKPLPPKRSPDNDYMHYVMEMMSYANYLIKVSASMAPNQVVAKRGYTKHSAIVVGHIVRLAKLYHSFTTHIGKRQLQIAYIMVRLIYECIIKMEYLFTAKRSTFKSFIITSYRSDKETLENLDLIKSQRPLMNIEKVIIKKIKSRLHKDRISLRQLKANRNWKLDGKDFKQVLISVKKEIDYPFLFGQGSSFIHGDWYEMSIFNLTQRGRYYLPDLGFSDPDPRIALPVTIAILHSSDDFLKWNKSDPEKHVRSIIHNLAGKIKILYDQYCEEKYADV
jgi:hypothetical protein